MLFTARKSKGKSNNLRRPEAVAQRCSVNSVSLRILSECGKITPATLLKKRLWRRCFPVNLAKFLRTPFFTEHLRWLLLEGYHILRRKQNSYNPMHKNGCKLTFLSRVYFKSFETLKRNCEAQQIIIFEHYTFINFAIPDSFDKPDKPGNPLIQ